MWIRKRRDWDLPERDATPEGVYQDRRRVLAALSGGVAGSAVAFGPGSASASWLNFWGGGDDRDTARQAAQAAADGPDPSAGRYPVPRNERYTVDRPITDERQATTYNNFYEFGTHTQIARAAQRLPIRPWTVVIDGMVEKPIEIGFDELLARMPLEERVYRFRCVEAWAMTVPWSGFPLAALVAFAAPLGSAKYLEMRTFGPDQVSSGIATGFRQSWYPWPYTEGLTLAEATNDLTFIATGLYGKPIPRQNGAPLRLVTPWKYGFKSVKSIVRFTFTDKRPVGLWEAIQSSEYGFWANVNPDVSHPRWSQAQERVLGTGEMRPTLLFNGYGEFVADLYKGLERERLWA